MNSINNCALFNEMSNKQIETFLSSTKSFTKIYSKGNYILMEGDSIDYIYIILSGKVQIYMLDSLGNTNAISNLATNNFFGPALALSNRNSFSTVEVVSECKLLHIPRLNLDIQSIETSIFQKNLLLAISAKNVDLNHKIMLLGIKDITERVLTFLMHHQDENKKTFTVSLNKQQIANYLFIDRSTLSRKLSKLKQLGVIDYNKNTYTIKDTSILKVK